MRVGFDAKRLFHNFTGLGNYSRFVVNALSQQYPGDSFVLFTPKWNNHPEVGPILNQQNISVVVPSGVCRYAKSIWRSYGISTHRETRSLDVYHGLSQELPYGLKGVKKVVTVHDLIYLRFPQFYNPIDVAIYTAKARSACRNADIVIAISKQTADDLKEYLNVPEEKIRIVYQGCHPIFRRKVDESERTALRSKYQLPSEYLLSVGTIEERKNIKVAVEALAMLPSSERVPFVIVGKKTPYLDHVKEYAAKNHVIDDLLFIHNAKFEDLPGIYQMAKAFVYPSLFEGFGIPIVEAIQSGLPVITSKGSCFAEAGGPDTLYFDPASAEDLKVHLSSVLGEQSVRARMIEGSADYISRFSPENIASDMMKVYRNALAG